jgi:hypothetical protein
LAICEVARGASTGQFDFSVGRWQQRRSDTGGSNGSPISTIRQGRGSAERQFIEYEAQAEILLI